MNNNLLNHQELQSSGVQKIVSHLNERLKGLRIENDKDRDFSDTARLRGQIREVKSLLMFVGKAQVDE